VRHVRAMKKRIKRPFQGAAKKKVVSRKVGADKRQNKILNTQEIGFESWRVKVIVFFLGVLICIVFFRIAWVKILQGKSYQEQADAQHRVEAVLSPYRGEIALLQQDGSLYPAAVNRLYYIAYIQPEIYAGDIVSASQQIASALEVDPADVLAKFQRQGDPYEEVKRLITKEEKEDLEQLEIEGLYFIGQSHRYYPGEQLAAHTIGFVGYKDDDLGGRYGVERSYESKLLGSGGSLSQVRDARGRWLSVSDRSLTPQKDGSSIVLTIEQPLQQAVESILAEDTVTYGAQSAVAIVAEAGTGRIIAMAQTPSFSLNEYGSVDDYGIYINQAISQPYESGSVFKTFTMAMGLDAQKITPQTTYVDEGFVQADIYPLRNAQDKVYGLQTMTQVLEESINTGVIFVQRQLGNKAFRQYVEDFGFGQLTGIDLPSESPGNLRNLANEKSFVEYYTASFGQGINVTPVQLVSAYGALANDGKLMRPRIVDHILNPDESKDFVESVEVRRVVSEEASDQIDDMLMQVVDGGHAKLAAVPGYRIGGKTGTAQVAKVGERGYDEERKNTTFVGYGPIEKSREDKNSSEKYVVLVKYENPTKAEWAATSAAPTFGRIMEFLLDYKDVPPTEPITFQEVQQISDDEAID
jgi:cell division protein FtsI (penicillin-binding protein 3)